VRKRTRARSTSCTELESDLREFFSRRDRSEGAAREMSEIPAARFCSIVLSVGSGGYLVGLRDVDFFDLALALEGVSVVALPSVPGVEDTSSLGGERRNRCWTGGRVRSSDG